MNPKPRSVRRAILPSILFINYFVKQPSGPSVQKPDYLFRQLLPCRAQFIIVKELCQSSHQFVYLGGDFRSFELISAETHLRSQGEENPPPTKNGLGGGESSRKERGGTREGCPVRMQFHTCGDHG